MHRSHAILLFVHTYTNTRCCCCFLFILIIKWKIIQKMLNFAMTNFHYTRAYHAPVTGTFYLFSSSGETNSNELFFHATKWNKGPYVWKITPCELFFLFPLQACGLRLFIVAVKRRFFYLWIVKVKGFNP